jgi:hypothetical protein
MLLQDRFKSGAVRMRLPLKLIRVPRSVSCFFKSFFRPRRKYKRASGQRLDSAGLHFCALTLSAELFISNVRFR